MYILSSPAAMPSFLFQEYVRWSG